MKSPFSNLPDLFPRQPRHDLRLQLTPSESVALYVCLDVTSRAMEDAPDASGAYVAATVAMLDGIRDKLGDKLDFKAQS